MTRILCIADDPADAAMLEDLLEPMGYVASLVAGAEHRMAAAAREAAAAILVVCQAPDHLGLALLRQFDRRPAQPPVIVLAGDASVEHAVSCMRAGAADYLPKPVRAETLRYALHHACTQVALRADRAGLSREAEARRTERRLVGRSSAIRDLRRMMELVAPTDAVVLIEGESGTGKELVARALHARSHRRDGPFITINCAAMPEGLVESTLFGHEKGSFTGALARTAGAFERADGGTLFLDEISEMRLDLQAKLLRVIQEAEFERVGGREVLRSNVRLLASTNRNLLAEVEAGRFRSDLYYRLHVVPIETPPLRSRPEDIPDLVDCFLATTCSAIGVAVPQLGPGTIEYLQRYPWPGNVRELLNALQRAVILSAGEPMLPIHFRLPATALPVEEGPPADSARPLPLNLAELEALAITRALEESKGHRANAAKLLGISERTLRNRLNTPIPGSLDSGGIGREEEILSA